MTKKALDSTKNLPVDLDVDDLVHLRDDELDGPEWTVIGFYEEQVILQRKAELTLMDPTDLYFVCPCQIPSDDHENC